MLEALSTEAYQRLAPNLERVDLTLGTSLVELRQNMGHVYFLTDSVVSLQCVMGDNDSTKIAVVDAEGLVGISLFMGARPHRA